MHKVWAETMNPYQTCSSPNTGCSSSSSSAHRATWEQRGGEGQQDESESESQVLLQTCAPFIDKTIDIQ